MTKKKYGAIGVTHLLAVMLGAIAFVTACSGGGSGGSARATAVSDPQPQPQPQLMAAPASVQRPLEVPQALADAPFNDAKTLTVPPGFGIRVWARINKARFMALAPNGDVLVSVPSEGRIVLLRERPNDTPEQFDYVTGLRQPHDMVFHTIGAVTYLYFTESNRVSRTVYESGETAMGDREIVVDNLPDGSLPELQGSYGHELKNIALGPDNKLYVSIASNCNACAEDAASNPVRGAIYQYTADGKEGKLFARGLRNAEGLDFIPGTNTLWVTVNNRDEIKFPLDVDIDGDGQSDLGRTIPAYVDDNPPELFTSLRDGGNYGWPFCNSSSASMVNMPLVPDYENNPGGSVMDCATADHSAVGIQAHAAPLGFSFLHNTNAPLAYRNGAAIALHGCWNCTTLKAGYKVTYFPFDAAGNAGTEMDLVTGFVTDAAQRKLWGRPVDVIADAKGNLLISDDYANAVYQLYPLP